MHGDGGLTYFHLFNKHYEMTLDSLNTLGLPTQEHMDTGSVMPRQAFWKDIAMKENGTYPKDSQYIMQASTWYAQIILANSIFATIEFNNKVKKRSYMDMATQHRIHHLRASHNGDRRLAHNNRVVSVRGIIALIVKFAYTNLEGGKLVLGLPHLNVTFLMKAKYIRVSFDQEKGHLGYHLRLTDKYFVLFSTETTSSLTSFKI